MDSRSCISLLIKFWNCRCIPPQLILMLFLFVVFFDSLTRELWLALNLQLSSCVWFPSAGMKDVHHYV